MHQCLSSRQLPARCSMLDALLCHLYMLSSVLVIHSAAFNLDMGLLTTSLKNRICASVKVSCLQAAIVIQKVWRGSLVRRNMSLADSAATIVQRYWRGHAQHTKFTRLRGTTVSLQARVRQWQAVRRFAMTRSAVVTIQVSTPGCNCASLARSMHTTNKTKACCI